MLDHEGAILRREKERLRERKRLEERERAAKERKGREDEGYWLGEEVSPKLPQPEKWRKRPVNDSTRKGMRGEKAFPSLLI